MREVNFSIPNVNKASVGITTALYDRRALDCTSTLPLINSLNHLAYLTTSSARIRDILTVDGGVERLVCILKHGRKDDMMEMWKWNLAFQCVVNIGVRGSEGVRRRVVEADMVPVIATVLNNYIMVTDSWREEKGTDTKRCARRSSQGTLTSRATKEAGTRTIPADHDMPTESRSLRPSRPPALQLPPLSSSQSQTDEPALEVITSAATQLSSPHNHSTVQSSQPPPSQRLNQTHIQDLHSAASRHGMVTANTLPSMDVADGFGMRPVRDLDRLPSIIPTLQTGMISQPESPTTPNAPVARPLNLFSRGQRMPSIRQQTSTSGDSDDGVNDMASDHSATSAIISDEAMIDLQTTLDYESVESGTDMLDGVAASMELTAGEGTGDADVDAFSIAHRAGLDDALLAADVPTTNADPAIGLRPPAPVIAGVVTPPSGLSSNQSRAMLERSVSPSTPRDEDVLMSLQLLAYVSKYCNLRSYFQKTHLVPKLQISRSSSVPDEPVQSQDEQKMDDTDDEEYLLPDDFNIFPLVEKFTVRHHHSQEMQNWAGVVMRNLCRKDDSRGGIRQCAYYECGKWEEKTRQFAKCRRCRRTKYCSKDCQKSAWVYHRHWCQVANP